MLSKVDICEMTQIKRVVYITYQVSRSLDGQGVKDSARSVGSHHDVGSVCHVLIDVLSTLRRDSREAGGH